MPQYANADRIVVRGFWKDEDGGTGVPGATVTFDPVPLVQGTTGTPNLRDLTAYGHLKLRSKVASVDPDSGYYAAIVVSNNDPDLDAYLGRRVTFSGESPFTIAIPYNAPSVTVDAPMAAAIPELTVGQSVKAIWLVEASLVDGTPPPPIASYMTGTQTLSAIATAIGTVRQVPSGGNAGQVVTKTSDAYGWADPPAGGGGGGSYSAENARDDVGAAMRVTGAGSLAVDDPGDTITINVDLPEATQSARTAALGTPTDLLKLTNRYDTTSAAVTQPLPPATAGRVLAVGLDAGTNALTFTANGSDVIGSGSATSLVLNLLGEVRTLHCTTAGRWRVVSGNTPTSALDARYAAAGSGGGGGLDPTDVGYDLILLLGQSNMSGQGTPYDVARFDPPVERIQQYGSTGTYAGVISQAIEPLAMHDTPAGIGPGSVFARWYLQTVPANRRVLLVPAAHMGTALATTATLGWRRGVAGNLYAQALAQTQAALAAAGANSRVVAALWLQGESDGNNSITGSAYQADLDALIAGLRTDLGVADLPFVIAQMLPEGLTTGTRNAVNSVHLATPSRLQRTAVALAPFGRAQDGDHFNAAGQRILGRRLLDAYRRVITATAEPALPSAPGQTVGLTTSAVTATGFTVTWSATSGAGAYFVQWKPTSSPTWQILLTTASLTASLGGLSNATSYDVRVTPIGNGGVGTPSAVLATTTGGTGDTTAPSTPANLAASPGNGQNALSWTASTDDVGVTGYRVYRGGTLVGSPTTTSFTDTGLTNGTSYSYTVAAIDAAGNLSAATAAVTATPTAGGVGAATYSTDSFTRADSASNPGASESGGLPWVASGGTWGIASNQLRCGGDNGNSLQATQCVVDSGTADGTVTATVASTGYVGLVLRAAGDYASTGYVLFNIGSAYRLSRRTSSGFTEVTSTSGVTPAAGDVLSVVMSGSNFTVKVNGTTRATATDSTTTGTRHGLFSYQGSGKLYDDWSHTA